VRGLLRRKNREQGRNYKKEQLNELLYQALVSTDLKEAVSSPPLTAPGIALVNVDASLHVAGALWIPAPTSRVKWYQAA